MVAARLGVDPAVRNLVEQPTQLPHVYLYCLAGRERRALLPEQVDHPVERHAAAGVQGERGQDRPGMGTPEAKRTDRRADNHWTRIPYRTPTGRSMWLSCRIPGRDTDPRDDAGAGGAGRIPRSMERWVAREDYVAYLAEGALPRQGRGLDPAPAHRCCAAPASGSRYRPCRRPDHGCGCRRLRLRWTCSARNWQEGWDAFT